MCAAERIALPAVSVRRTPAHSVVMGAAAPLRILAAGATRRQRPVAALQRRVGPTPFPPLLLPLLARLLLGPYLRLPFQLPAVRDLDRAVRLDRHDRLQC